MLCMVILNALYIFADNSFHGSICCKSYQLCESLFVASLVPRLVCGPGNEASL